MLDVLLLFPREGDASAVDAFLTQRLIPALTEAKGMRSLRLSQGTIMSRGDAPPYSRILEASFDSLADWWGVVEASMAQPADRDTFDRLAPLVIFYEVSEPR
jgi:hypothetical protein